MGLNAPKSNEPGVPGGASGFFTFHHDHMTVNHEFKCNLPVSLELSSTHCSRTLGRCAEGSP